MKDSEHLKNKIAVVQTNDCSAGEGSKIEDSVLAESSLTVENDYETRLSTGQRIYNTTTDNRGKRETVDVLEFERDM